MDYTGKSKFDFITFCYILFHCNDSWYFSNVFYVNSKL